MQFHKHLRFYKDSFFPRSQPPIRRDLAAFYGVFMQMHAECISAVAGSTWDVVTTVPSTSGREGKHPLNKVIDMVPWAGQSRRKLLRVGSSDADHRQADDGAFEARKSANGAKVLLVDDTFTSGARLQSAASALTVGGATVVAAVVLGRFVRPGWGAVTDTWIRDQRRERPFDWETCCLE